MTICSSQRLLDQNILTAARYHPAQLSTIHLLRRRQPLLPPQQIPTINLLLRRQPLQNLHIIHQAILDNRHTLHLRNVDEKQVSTATAEAVRHVLAAFAFAFPGVQRGVAGDAEAG